MNPCSRRCAVAGKDSIWAKDLVDINSIPVQVVGRVHEGVWEFPNLAAAQKQFPELDLYQSTSQFTWAMRGEVRGEPALRFETWAAYGGYSM